MGTLLDELKSKFEALREEDRRKSALKERRTAPTAEAAKSVGMARGAMNSMPLVQKARRIAREMMENGPVTIEDVCDRMAADNDPVWAGSKDAPKNWKGSVFNDPCFVCVGSIPSRKETNHGRHVRQWALKSWLRDHPMNGDTSSVSAFSVIRIYNQYMHEHAGCDTGSLVWILGTNMLSDDVRIVVGDDDVPRLYGIRVVGTGGVGAVLCTDAECPVVH